MELIHGGDWAGFEMEYGTRPLDFSACVSPLGLPEGARKAICAAAADTERYPDPLCRALRQALAAHDGAPADSIVCGAGAADLIWRLCRTLRPKKAALFVPCFAEYERALAFEGCEIVRLPLPGDFRLTADVAALVPPDTELLFVCNPNNPTGLLAERLALQALLELCRARGMTLAVDECFLDFCADPAKHSLVGALAETPELVILKAFTKTYAMAGLRLGYALCGRAALADRLRSCGQPWPVSAPAQAAGTAALRDEEYVKRLRALIAAERRRLIPALKALGLRVIPGEANFLLFHAGDPTLADTLRARGILIRDCRNFDGLTAGWYRIAVRTREENDRLLTALREVLHG